MRRAAPPAGGPPPRDFRKRRSQYSWLRITTWEGEERQARRHSQQATRGLRASIPIGKVAANCDARTHQPEEIGDAGVADLLEVLPRDGTAAGVDGGNVFERRSGAVAKIDEVGESGKSFTSRFVRSEMTRRAARIL
jgi:hypothetical protein